MKAPRSTRATWRVKRAGDQAWSTMSVSTTSEVESASIASAAVRTVQPAASRPSSASRCARRRQLASFSLRTRLRWASDGAVERQQPEVVVRQVTSPFGERGDRIRRVPYPLERVVESLRVGDEVEQRVDDIGARREVQVHGTPSDARTIGERGHRQCVETLVLEKRPGSLEQLDACAPASRVECLR